MKHLAKKAAFGLAALTLVTSLASCGRREHFQQMLESKQEAESLADYLREETSLLELDTRPRETLAVAPDTEPPETDDMVSPGETDETVETGEPETDSYGLPVLDNAVDPNDPYPNGEGYRMTAVLNLGLPAKRREFEHHTNILPRRYFGGSIVRTKQKDAVVVTASFLFISARFSAPLYIP